MGGTRDQWLFSCLCWELCWDFDERQEGGFLVSQQWCVEARLEQQTLLLLGTLLVPAAISSYSTIPKAFPVPCSQQVALVALAQSCGQDLPSPCLLPTVTVQGLALIAGVFTSTFHCAFYCSHSLQATFPPNRARSAVFRKAHGLAKPDLAKGSVGVFIPEVRKLPNHLLHS